MSSLLNIGTAATATFQTAIATTSHNIANVGTDGYNRQRTEIVSNILNRSSGTGSGSRVDSVERVYASYIQDQLSSTNSLLNRYEEQLSLSQNVEGIVAGNDEGIQEFMQRFFDSLQNLSDNPTSVTNRTLVLDEANNMETLINNLSSVLTESQAQTNTQIEDLTQEINERLDLVQTINKEVASAFSSGSQLPNDLLDQRDQAIFELNSYMDVKTFPQENGEIAIYTGDTRLPLVNGNSVNHLIADRTEFSDESRTEVYMIIGGEKRQISDSIGQGQLGAVLDFRENMLDPALNELGVTLNGLVASMNWQHYQGYDANGDAGQDFYTPLSANASASNKNTGPEDGTNITVSFQPEIDLLAGYNGQPPYTPVTQPNTYGDKEAFLDVATTAIGEFQAREYEVRVNAAGDFEVYDHKEGGAPLATIPFGTNAEIDGLDFDFTGVGAGTVATGDKFLIKPHQQILEDFSTEINDENAIAARGQTPVDSDSDGSLLDEAPSAAASGDNVNMANMASLQTKKILYSDASGQAAESLLGGYSKMATNIGMYVRGTEIQLTAQTNVFDQISERRESMSGVSLDEEAANLLRYRQAYEASAQIIQTSQTLFQTILGAMN
jgi:flagellar hook-associated protein 1 FlgK